MSGRDFVALLMLIAFIATLIFAPRLLLPARYFSSESGAGLVSGNTPSSGVSNPPLAERVYD